MQDVSFVLQGKISENFSLVVVNDDDDLCKSTDPKDCLTVALYIETVLEFIIKPVYSLLLEVEVRNNVFTFTGKVINNLLFF
jgi:hypothetical protein